MPSTSTSIAELLQRSRTIAVAGLSANPGRPSNGVAQYLQRNGYRIIPINPTYAGTHILGEYCYDSLQAAASALAKENVKIDIVDCFRKSEAIPPIVDAAIEIGVQCVWMQLGVAHEEAAAKARARGIDVVMDNCIKIEHMNLA